MLSNQILDKLIPLPTEDTLLEQIKSELDETGFPISYYKSGGIFYTLLRIFIRIKVEFISLARNMLSNSFVSTADDIGWLEARAADYSKRLKQAVKTRGNITLSRTDTETAVKIAKGCVFKTEPDANGDELRFISTADVFCAIGADTCLVPVEAEAAGSAYNLPAGKITRCLLHIAGITGITNAKNWITREGADTESIESLRSRTLNSFADLATMPTRDKYKSACEAVAGVLYVSIDDMHPRGQGTVDIIVTSPTGSASEDLLADVLAAAKSIAGAYDNLLVRPSETISQDLRITIVLPVGVSDDGMATLAEQIIRKLFEVNKNRILNELYLSDLIVALKSEIHAAKSIRILEPASDVVLGIDKVIVLGDVSITIERA